MILAEKIALLRKRGGWSQEDLAQQMEVSRQAVSKWESGASIPDLDKVLKMSELFSVTTDYLLKDQLEEAVPGALDGEEKEAALPAVSLEQANDFMDLTRRYAPRNALAVVLLILSPVCLILLGGLSEFGSVPFSEDAAGGLGMIALLMLAAAGVVWLILNDMRFSAYAYLEKEPFALTYGVRGIVEKRREEYAPTYRIAIAAGTGLCILGVVPLMAAVALEAGELSYVFAMAALLALVAAGVYLFVRSGSVQECFDKLLQQGDYTPQQKALRRRMSFFPVAYWCIATAVYLGISFSYDNWSRSWIVWPVAGVLFAASYAIVKAVMRTRQPE